jgi:RHS repeat-associated protein
VVTLPAAGDYTLEVTSRSFLLANYAFELQQLSPLPLTVGEVHPYRTDAAGTARLFTFEMTEPGPLVIDFGDSNPKNRTELYLQREAAPTRRSYDHAREGSDALHDLFVPFAAPGTWYLLAYNTHVEAPSDSELLVETPSIVVIDSLPRNVEVGETITVSLQGAGFVPGVQVEMVGNQASYAASSVSVESWSQIQATFDLTDAAPGLFDLRVTRGDGTTAVLTGAIETFAFGSPELIYTNIVSPGSVGRHATSTFYIEYENRGTLPVPAPILTLQSADPDNSDRPLFTLDRTQLVRGFWTAALPDGFTNAVSITASGDTPGILRPGESSRVPVYYAGLQQPWDFSDTSVELEIRIRTAADPTPVDWPSLRSALRPAWIEEQAWDAVYQVLTDEIGATWGDYIVMLTENETYLNRLGVAAGDVDSLFQFEVQQAATLAPISDLDNATDLSLPSIGVPLEISRSFGATILDRYASGPLGHGWKTQWDMRLELEPDGTAVVHVGPGHTRRFQPDSRRIGRYFSSSGDDGSLRKLMDNTFELTESDGRTTRFAPSGELLSLDNGKGSRVEATHVAGQLAELVHSNGESLSFTYDGTGLVKTITDSHGRLLTYTYDVANRHLLSVTGPAGTTTYGYHADETGPRAHALTSITSAAGVVTHFEYDDHGRLTARWIGDDEGRIEYSYGSAGEITAIDASGVATTRLYDHRELLVRENGPRGWISYVYDDEFRLRQEIDALGRPTSYTWDDSGELLNTTDALGNGLTLDLQEVMLSGGAVAHLPRQSRDPLGNVTQYKYDANGYPSATVYADGTSELFDYDATGNPTRLTNRRGQVQTFAYNAQGQTTRQEYVEGIADLTYDSRGRLQSVTYAGATTSYAYDAADRLTRVDYPHGRWIGWEFDQDGNRTQQTDSSGHVVNYKYDSAGRLKDVRDGTDRPIVSYSYDAAGRMQREQKGNGTYTDYAYDDLGRVSVISHFAPDDTLNARFHYEFDAVGNRTTLTTLDGVWNYDYDPTGQLIRATFASSNPEIASVDLSYAYDANGNLTHKSANDITAVYESNSLNQYTHTTDATFDYDASGNLIRQTDNAGTTTYQYNSLGRLVAVQSPTGSWHYEYDIYGNRTAMTRDGKRTEYLVDPTGLGNVVGTYDAQGQRSASFIYGQNLEAIDTGGVRGFYDFDAQGSTAGVTGSSGTLDNRYVYDPYGVSLLASELIQNPFEYVGAEGVMEDGSGMLHMRARYYLPTLGRFASPDPLGLAGDDYNLYRYVDNAPTMDTDPTGLIANSLKCQLYRWLRDKGMPIAKAYDSYNRGNANVKSACDPDDDEDDANDNKKGPAGPPPGGGGGGQGGTGTANSSDPNDKLGSAGFGDRAFIRRDEIIPYRINFENLGPGSDPVPTQPATAPAQRVEITDQLSEHLDWSTLRFVDVGFGDTVITVPNATQYYFTTVPMTYNNQMFDVELELTFDNTTGELSVVFQSISPDTLLPPDVLTGFLPPEDGTGIGKGFVGFEVTPRQDLPSGTEIRNIALISFDRQTIIATNQVDPQDASKGTNPNKEALNTIDAGAPASQVSAQSPFSPPETEVSWSGTDDTNGSGVAAYDVYVSVDDGEFQLWLQGTTDTSMRWIGEAGRTYQFYSVAIDNVGHREDVPDSADAATRITLPGDGNLDGKVDGEDFTLWMDHRFADETGWATGDYNLDGSTDARDFQLWNSNKFQQIAAPEGAALSESRPVRAPLQGEAVALDAFSPRLATASSIKTLDASAANRSDTTYDDAGFYPPAISLQLAKYRSQQRDRRAKLLPLSHEAHRNVEWQSLIDKVLSDWRITSFPRLPRQTPS